MHPYPAPRPPSAPCTAQAFPAPGADSWTELEEIVDRLARLVLHAHALAERTAGLRVPPEGLDPGRANRLARLRAGVDLGSRALQAAARVDVPSVTGIYRRRLPPTPRVPCA